MAREDPHFRLRFPNDLREKVLEAATANHRSMTAEIIARLEVTFERLGDYNVFGIDSLSRRLEASIEAAEVFALRLACELRSIGGVASNDDKAISEAIAKYAEIINVNKAVSTQIILKDWLIGHGLLEPDDDEEDSTAG